MRKFYRQDLENQYKNDANFRRKVLKSQKQYAQILESSKKSNDWQKSINQSVLQIFTTQDNRVVYFFYGFLQPPPGRKKIQLMFYFINNFRPDPQRQYSFVYFNHKTPSSEYYFEFESIFSLLPISLLERLNSFILVKPYLYIKAWDYVGFANIHKTFQQHYQTIDQTPELLKKFGITPYDFVQFVPEQLSDEFPSNFKRKPSLATYRINFQGQLMSQQQLKDRRDFQNTIKALFTKEVYKLQNYELGQIGIPIILQVLVNYFKAKHQGLKIQGIFRKSVSVDEQAQIMEQLSQRNYDYILSNVGNPHIIACLIKKFFSNLKQPIIPFAQFDQLMHDQQANHKKQYFKSIIKKLPQLNALTLTFIIDFLKKDVIIHEKQSKMNAHNISICFSPAFMRSEKPSMADILYAQKAVTITEMMVVDLDSFFGDQSTRTKIFQKNMLNKKKDFKKTIRQQLNISLDMRPSEQFQCMPTIQESQPTRLSQNQSIHQQYQSIPQQYQQQQIYIVAKEAPKQPQTQSKSIIQQFKAMKVSSQSYEIENKQTYPKSSSQTIHIEPEQQQNGQTRKNFRRKMIQMILNKAKNEKMNSNENGQHRQWKELQVETVGEQKVEDVSQRLH